MLKWETPHSAWTGQEKAVEALYWTARCQRTCLYYYGGLLEPKARECIDLEIITMICFGTCRVNGILASEGRH